MFIYVIVCSENLKIYVGQHKGDDLQHYLQQKQYEARTRLKARSHLYAALRMHPRASWSIHPLVAGIESRFELDALEQHYIRALNTRHPDVGYNLCRGGEGFTGPHTPEWRKETLERIRAYWANPENRKLRSQEMKTQWQNPEWRQAQTSRMQGNQYNTGRVQSAAEKNARSAGLLLYHRRKRQEQDSAIHK
jgi:hypothetical protein